MLSMLTRGFEQCAGDIQVFASVCVCVAVVRFSFQSLRFFMRENDLDMAQISIY